MKALEILKELKESRDFDGNIEYKIDAAIKELESLELYVKSLEEYRRLVRYFLQVENCS